MKYTTSNLMISLTTQFATRLLENGFAVYWASTKETDDPDSMLYPTPVGTVTLVSDFPTDPVNVTRSPRLNDGTVPSEGQILVPAFALSIDDSPIRIRRVGLGQAEFERWLTVYIYGFTYDDFQQRKLKDVLYDWLQIGDVRLQVWDYDSNAVTPSELESMDVINAQVTKEERVTEIEAIRYYVAAEIIVSYFE
jgi:hypothetical protein